MCVDVAWQAPIIGAQHKIKDLSGKTTSYLKYYFDVKQKSFHSTTDSFDSDSLLNQSINKYASNAGDLTGNLLTNLTYLQALVTVECFFLECAAESTFCVMLKKMGDKDSVDNVEFCPMTTKAFEHMMIIFTADKTETFEYVNPQGETVSVCGREYKEGMINKMVRAVNYIHHKCNYGSVSPCKDVDMRRWITGLKSKHPGGDHQAPTIDYVEALPALYNGVWSNDKDNFFKKAYKWTMVLFFMWFAARPKEVAEYCPYVEHIRWPSCTADYDVDGIPKWVEIGFRDWKHRRARDVQKGPFYMIVYRNYLESKYCLLFWLIVYMKYLKTEKGPLFRNRDVSGKAIDCFPRKVKTDKGDQFFYFKGVEEKSHRANLSVEVVNETLRDIFNRSGFPLCTGYSFRRSSVKWWRICGAQEWEIKNGGRWHSGWLHAAYLEEGQLDHLSKEGNHPIRKMWVWKPNTRHEALAAEFRTTLSR